MTTDAKMDVIAGEPGSLAELRAEFPDWIIDRGMSGLYYGRRPRDSPILSGEDLLDLQDHVLAWIRRHARHELTAAGRVRSIACTWCDAPSGAACDRQNDADHLMRYARARHAGLITAEEHAVAIPAASTEGGAPMMAALPAGR